MLNNVFLRGIKHDGSHGENEKQEYFGLGIIYYAIPYMLKARMWVCLGSGSGFVPSLMRAAQKEAKIKGETILIDANLPEAGWGSPHYLASDSAFRQAWSDIQIIVEKSVDAAKRFPNKSIDYLHIDGDHSYEGISLDCETYFPIDKPGFWCIIQEGVAGSIPSALARSRLMGLSSNG